MHVTPDPDADADAHIQDGRFDMSNAPQIQHFACVDFV